MTLLRYLVVLLLLVGCTQHTDWELTTSTPIPTTTILPTNTLEPTLIPSATPRTHYLPGEMVHAGIPPGVTDWHYIIDLYYRPSPDEFYGYATRYGSFDKAIRELHWHAQEIKDQMVHSGYPLIGGGYGFWEFEGKEYLISNRESLGYTIIAEGGYTVPLTEQQTRMLKLAELSQDDLKNYVYNTYVGVISTRSPNDVGRIYCVYKASDEFDKTPTVVGKVIVGGNAKQEDWTPFGDSVNDTYNHARLGLRVFVDPLLTEWNWAADVTDELYAMLYDSYLNTSLLFLVVSNDDSPCPYLEPRP